MKTCSLQGTTSLDFLKLVKLGTALDLEFLCTNAQPLALWPHFLPADQTLPRNSWKE